jgi:hypothetical protein
MQFKLLLLISLCGPSWSRPLNAICMVTTDCAKCVNAGCTFYQDNGTGDLECVTFPPDWERVRNSAQRKVECESFNWKGNLMILIVVFRFNYESTNLQHEMIMTVELDTGTEYLGGNALWSHEVGGNGLWSHETGGNASVNDHI